MNSDSIEGRGPIFIVGSPRSGTSVLTWCLGQHPNILALEESNWMTQFALDVASAHRRGSARGERSQLSSMGVGYEDFMQTVGRGIESSIIDWKGQFEKRRRELATPGSEETHPAFKISRENSDPKQRWVNGTPEYSFGICGLRKLFPAARFIHLVRACDPAALSMSQFERLAGFRLADTIAQGHQLWMTYVRACIAAEEAYGSSVVYRVLFQDVVEKPQPTMERILAHLGEPFSPNCVEPLMKKINSSEVEIARERTDEGDISDVSREARALSQELHEYSQPEKPSLEAAALLEEAFERRVDYDMALNEKLQEVSAAHAAARRELDERTQWALRLDAELAQNRERLLRLQEEFESRTKWALTLQAEVSRLKEGFPRPS